MPHGNKKAKGNSNKKKTKGPGGGCNPRQRAGIRSNGAHQQRQRSNRDLFGDIHNLPSFHENRKKRSHSQMENLAGAGGYYEIYKRATNNFCHWMKAALPDAKMTTVNDLQRGAAHILEVNVAVLDGQRDPPAIGVAPYNIVNDLETSITYRQKMAAEQYGGGMSASPSDRGHQHMLGVLKYCRVVLQMTRTIAKEVAKQRAEPATPDNVGGRFDALGLTDEEEAEDRREREQMERDVHERNFPAEPEQQQDEDIDIEQVLINGDDRFQAQSLLHSMEDLMQAVEQHYGVLKNVMQGDNNIHQGSSVIQLLMECTVAANMATQTILTAENALYASHPHIKSFYHVLALVFLPCYIADVAKLVKPEALQQDPHVALHFVARIAECSFHNRGDTRIAAIVKKYAKQCFIKVKDLELEAEKIHMVTMHEVQLACEERLNGGINAMFRQQTGMNPHSWLARSPSIGGSRCILNTQKITQMFLDIVKDSKLVGRPGVWGPSLDDNKPATSIRGGLDEAFGGMMLPELIEICRQAPFHILPDLKQLMTVMHLLERHLKNGDHTRPVSIGLTFGLHAMLTSVFVLQGDGDLAKAATITKASFGNLFKQLDAIADPSKPPENAPTFYANVQMFKQIINFSKPVPAKYDTGAQGLDPELSEQLAFWNPVIGGEYMLYATYMCSIGLGSVTIDSLGQLRFVMHLYNALREQDNGLTIPLLSQLQKSFDKTKALWVGGRPEKGAFCKHFWMAWGMTSSDAAIIASEGFSASEFSVRELEAINPDDFSESYRRLVLQDFTDDQGVAGYTALNMPKKAAASHLSLTGLLTRVNMIRDAMDDDEEFVMSTNFPAVGCILLDFVDFVSEELSWDAIIQEAIDACPEVMQTGKTMAGKQMVPGSFNTSDLNIRGQTLAHLWGKLLLQLDGQPSRDFIQRISGVMTTFFKKIPKSRYQYRVENDDQIKLLSSNPLNGTYPYGRTGKTPNDPLGGILHYKYSKAGLPVVRMIKPGRQTPFLMGHNGFADNPYTEIGSKLPRQANGKYRHIASYSMEELLTLGWDGATYTSTKGKHAALGQHVPFIPGYDSDEDDEYEPIDIVAGKRAGVIGLPPQDNGLYVTIPDLGDATRPRLFRIKNNR